MNTQNNSNMDGKGLSRKKLAHPPESRELKLYSVRGTITPMMGELPTVLVMGYGDAVTMNGDGTYEISGIPQGSRIGVMPQAMSGMWIFIPPINDVHVTKNLKNIDFGAMSM